MNDMIDTGGPAFPSHGSMGEVVCDGMTIRDYLAAKAMQAVVTAVGSWAPAEFRDFDVDAASEYAYRQADAMLNAREK